MPGCADDQRVIAGQLVRVIYTAGMSDHPHFSAHGFYEFSYSLGFVFRIKSALEPFVMGGDAGGAGVLIALHGLNTAECKHETSCRGNEIRACAKGPSHFGRRDQFARGNDPHPIPQSGFCQCVYGCWQAFADGQTHIVDERHGCGPGATVAAVQCDEIRCAVCAAFCDGVDEFL